MKEIAPSWLDLILLYNYPLLLLNRLTYPFVFPNTNFFRLEKYLQTVYSSSSE